MSADSAGDDSIVLDTTRRIFADLADPQDPPLDGGAWAARLWPTLEEAGLTLAWAPEERGGVGATMQDGFGILRIAGQYASPAPLAETLIAAWALSRAGLDCAPGPMSVAMLRPADALTLDADGRLDGRLSAVPYAKEVERIVALAAAPDGAEHVVVFAAGDATAGERAVDLGAARADLSLAGVTPIAQAPASFGRAALLGLGAVARVQEMSGALETMLQISTDYVQERVAFGRPLGKFQAVQQNLARLAGEVAAALTAASSSADTLARFEEDPASGITEDDVFLEVASAKIRTGEAATEGPAIAHQAHGAIGFTSEYRLQRFSRALWRWRDDFGAESVWALELGEKTAAAGAEALWPALTRR